MSTKLNQLFGVVERLTRKTSVPDIFQEEVGASSVVDNVSGDSNSSESVVPVYSDDHLALYTGETVINLEHDPQFRHRLTELETGF